MKRTLALTTTLLALATTATHARLVAWYPFDEAADAPDTVTEAVTGTDDQTLLLGFDPDPEFSFITRGHPSAKPGLGTSYLLEKGGGIDLGFGEAVQPTDKFTISFWFQLHTFNAFDRFFESQSTNTNAQDGIRIDTGGGAGNHVRVLVRDNNGATNTQFQHPTVLRNDGTWYFVAFRYDSDGIDNDPFQLTLLEHTGDPVDENSIFDATGLQNTVTTGPIGYPHAFNSLLGVEIPNNPAHGNNINAALDEFAIWDNEDGGGVLTDAQLADVYNFGPSGVELLTSFTTDRESVSPGNPATLSWEVNEPFDTLTLDDGDGNVTDLAPLTNAGSGTTQVTPSQTTTYTLRVTRGGAFNASNIRILAGAAPDIASFTASARFVQVGGSVDLNWNAIGADSLQLDPGETDVTGLTTTGVTPAETTTYTLTATNPFGSTTSDVTVNVIASPVPAHRYVAATDTNTDGFWNDEIGVRNWTVTGAFRDAPLVEASPNTNLGGAYTVGDLSGAATGTFNYPEFTAELWLRPGDLTADHEVIFESGGGQNGVGILVNNTAFRFIGSILDERTVDLTVPVAGLNLDDFVQVVLTNSVADATMTAEVRDTFGNVRTATGPNGVIGGNGAGLFTWASGAIAANVVNLGGRTEAPDADPEIITSFLGEIAVLNVFDRVLTGQEVQQSFDAVASTTEPPVSAPFLVTSVARDATLSTLEVTWTSQSGKTYNVQFSSDLTGWFDLAGPFTADGDTTTQTLNVPPNADNFYVRVVEAAAP